MNAFTLFHAALSLVGIVSGLIVVFGMLGAKRMDGVTAIFLVTTILTSVTGFFFPFEKLLPSHIVGIISLVVLTVTLIARYARHLEGVWRWIYVVTAMIALWFNCFVLVVQLFLKVPALHELAPKGSEPPFAIAQLAVLAVLIALTVLSVKKFKV